MKKIFLSFFIFLFGCSLFGGLADCVYSNLSYTQFGVLKFNDSETQVSIFVKKFPEKTVMQMESEMGMLMRLAVDNSGKVILAEGSLMFRKSWVENFALRDFLILTGKANIALNPKKIKFSENCTSKAKLSYGDDYSIDFSDFKFEKNLGRKLPRKVLIKDETYEISLDAKNFKPLKKDAK